MCMLGMRVWWHLVARDCKSSLCPCSLKVEKKDVESRSRYENMGVS